MKFYKRFDVFIISALISLNIGCKKYGVEIADGYDDASGNIANVSVDTNAKFIDKSAYARARIFPGLVDDTEKRFTDQKFTLDLNFANQTRDNLRISVAPEPQFSTGYYAAPGELIKIIVPAGVNGLSMQIGGHTDDLRGKPNLLRDPVVYAVKPLYPGVNYMRNIYGGTIYINASFAIPQPVTFTITGAVASPDFVLGVDKDADWIAKVRASKVPWLELRSKRVVFLVPHDKVIASLNSGQIKSPEALMIEWNNKFELDYNGWMGLSDNAADERDRSPQGPWRGVLDIQLSKGYGHSGFPFVGLNDMHWYSAMVEYDRLMNSDGMWGVYHEFGHNCQQNSVWSWSTLGETSNNLFNFKAANRVGANYSILHPSVTKGFPQAVAYASKVAAGKNFNVDGDMNDPFKRMTPFIQIFELYGYGAMTKLYVEARHAKRLAISDIDKQDFVYEKFSEYAGVDLFPFFYFWGILVSEKSKTLVAAKYPMLNKAIWEYNPLTKTGGNKNIIWPVTVTASSTTYSQSPDVPDRMFDGDINTMWHNKYSGTAPLGVFPYTFDLDLNVVKSYKSISFVQRQNNINGFVKDVTISSSNDGGKTYTKVGDYRIPNNINRNTYTFPAPLNTRYFKVVFVNSWSGNATASMAEITINP